MANEKAQKYAGQLISIKRKTTMLSVTDRLSHVDDSTDATYLELLHPASVYRMSILGDIQKGLSVVANIRPEDIKLIWMRLKFAEKKLFEQEMSQKASTETEDNGAMKSDAFTVTFTMGRLKGKTPGGYLMETSDKEAAIKDLHSQYDFLAQNVAKYSANQKVMDAIKNAIEYYELGALDKEANNAASSADDIASEVEIYAPPEKTFRKDIKKLPDGRVLTKCYHLQTAFLPSNTYPNRGPLPTRYGQNHKNPNNGMETIRSVGSELSESRTYKMSLSSGEMVSVISAMEENLHYYKSCVYTGMRTKDQKLQEINRKAWKPQ